MKDAIYRLKEKLAFANRRVAGQWRVAHKLNIEESRMSRILNGRQEAGTELLKKIEELLDSDFFDVKGARYDEKM